MSACYSCHTTLNKKNQSVEHIIPNSIGGTLKSSRLICRECNNAYGMTIDAALAKDFEHLSIFLSFDRDRPKPHIKDNLNPVPARPIMRIENGRLYITGGNKEQIIQIASGIKRKFPGINMENIERKFHEDKKPAQHDVTIDFSVGSDLFMRAVAKIAANYYLMKVRGNKYLSRIIAIINGVETNDHDIHYHPLPARLWNDGEISHVIIIKGDPSLKQLSANVILFNTYGVVINLCNEYDGDQIDLFYRYDIFLHQEIKDKIELNYNRSEFLATIQCQPDEWNKKLIASIQDNLGRILHIAQSRHSKPFLDEMLELVFNKVISKYPVGKIITQDIAHDVHGAIFTKSNNF